MIPLLTGVAVAFLGCAAAGHYGGRYWRNHWRISPAPLQRRMHYLVLHRHYEHRARNLPSWYIDGPTSLMWINQAGWYGLFQGPPMDDDELSVFLQIHLIWLAILIAEILMFRPG